MKRSDRWFSDKVIQDTRARISTLQVLSRVGPDNASEPTRDRNDKDEKYFEVDKSEVGGEEVVG
jgi:hypothetical protein